MTAEEPPREANVSEVASRGKVLRLQPNPPRCSPTVSITTQRPHVVDSLRARPVGVPDHYLAHW